MRTLGVDFSHWEGKIDWEQAAPSIGFAYYKCTDGVKFVDAQFHANQQGCRNAGLAHAPYHFYQPALDPLAQAEHFIRTAGKGYQRYIADVEVGERFEHLSERLLAFLQKVEHLSGIRPAIYTSAGYWNDFMRPSPSWVKDYELIIAHYTLDHEPTLPEGWTAWRIWQFSNDWSFRGCTEQADANWFNGSLEECRTWFGNTSAELPLPARDNLQVRSLFDNLHIRQTPSINARIIGHLSKGEIVDVEELGGDDVRVRHAQGWTVVEHGGYRYMEILK